MATGGQTEGQSLFGDLAGLTARLMAYTLLAIVLMALDFRGRYIERVHVLAGYLVEPVMLLIEAPFAAAGRLREEFTGRQTLLERIAVLEQARRLERARLELLEELARENEELRELLGAARRLPVHFQPAEMLSVDLDPFAHRVLINRGGSDGLRDGQPVVDGGGVIGQVDRVFRHTARVILISDPDHALPVQVRRTGLRTIAYGTGSADRLKLSDLPMNVDLEAGDLLVTSGLGGLFPPGLPVAEIVSVDRPDGQPFATAVALPLGFMDRGRHVLVIAMASPDNDADAEVVAGPETGEEP